MTDQEICRTAPLSEMSLLKFCYFFVALHWNKQQSCVKIKGSVAQTPEKLLNYALAYCG